MDVCDWLFLTWAFFFFILLETFTETDCGFASGLLTLAARAEHHLSLMLPCSMTLTT